MAATDRIALGGIGPLTTLDTLRQLQFELLDAKGATPEGSGERAALLGEVQMLWQAARIVRKYTRKERN